MHFFLLFSGSVLMKLEVVLGRKKSEAQMVNAKHRPHYRVKTSSVKKKKIPQIKEHCGNNTGSNTLTLFTE